MPTCNVCEQEKSFAEVKSNKVYYVGRIADVRSNVQRSSHIGIVTNIKHDVAITRTETTFDKFWEVKIYTCKDCRRKSVINNIVGFVVGIPIFIVVLFTQFDVFEATKVGDLAWPGIASFIAAFVGYALACMILQERFGYTNLFLNSDELEKQAKKRAVQQVTEENALDDKVSLRLFDKNEYKGLSRK
ncbi:MAG: hypothetical protein JXQ72_17000 [Anaerolineae bacterium]|nr:hypothetical protein [Anaerolineae bacterium]